MFGNPNTIMRKRIYLELNNNEKRILQIIAESKGFRDYNILLHREIHGLPNLIKQTLICTDVDTRATTAIAISEDVFDFYERLSRSHSTNPTSIVSKYIIYPVIKKFMIEDEKPIIKVPGV